MNERLMCVKETKLGYKVIIYSGRWNIMPINYVSMAYILRLFINNNLCCTQLVFLMKPDISKTNYYPYFYNGGYYKLKNHVTYCTYKYNLKILQTFLVNTNYFVKT